MNSKIILLISFSISLLLALPSFAQRAPRNPKGIFGVRKNAVRGSKVYSPIQSNLRGNYFGSDPAAKKNNAVDVQEKNKNQQPQQQQMNSSGQAIPEGLIEKANSR